jgi:hypothetical protein
MDKNILIKKIAEEIAQSAIDKEAQEVYTAIENEVLDKLAAEINEQEAIGNVENEVLDKLAGEIAEEELLDEAIYQYLMNKEAKGMNPGLRAYLDKKKAGKDKEVKKEAEYKETYPVSRFLTSPGAMAGYGGVVGGVQGAILPGLVEQAGKKLSGGKRLGIAAASAAAGAGVSGASTLLHRWIQARARKGRVGKGNLYGFEK